MTKRTKITVAMFFLATIAVGAFAVYIGGKLSDRPDPTTNGGIFPTNLPETGNNVTSTPRLNPAQNQFTGTIDIEQDVVIQCTTAQTTLRAVYQIEIINDTSADAQITIESRFSEDFDDALVENSSITFGGTYIPSSKRIVWGDENGLLLRASSSVTLEFVLAIVESDFGTYSNIASVYEFDKDADPLGESNNSEQLDCTMAPSPTLMPTPTEIPPTPIPTTPPQPENLPESGETLPQTALISDSADRILLAFASILVGTLLLWTNIPSIIGSGIWNYLTYEPSQQEIMRELKQELSEERSDFEKKLRDKL